MTGNATARIMRAVYHKYSVVERVVCNALDMRRCRQIFCASGGISCHRLADKTIHQKFLKFFLSNCCSCFVEDRLGGVYLSR